MCVCTYVELKKERLELKKENNSNSCASFLDIYIYIENGEFHTKLFDKRDNFVTNKITRSLNIFFCKENRQCYYFSVTIYLAFTFQRPLSE